MTSLSNFYGPNAGYVLDLYEQYVADANSVDETTRRFFEHFTPDTPQVVAGQSSPLSVADAAAVETALPSGKAVEKVVGASRLARYIRHRGHLAARIDPLGGKPHGDPGLLLETHDLTDDDLDHIPVSVVGGPCGEGASSFRDAIQRLYEIYSGSVGYEDDHIQSSKERDWLREAVESQQFFATVTDADKRELLERLTEVETFERYLHTTFVAQKRFSIEGTDMIVPLLDHIIRCAAKRGTREVVIGMSHRGRLNVLAHVLGKSYSAIISEFNSAHALTQAVSGGGSQRWTGDVKYHLGARRSYRKDGGKDMPITLASNPSHLEFVDPVVEGRARAAQENRLEPGVPSQDMHASLPIIIHGDAAFPGQGVVAETLNLGQIPGYRVGGTVHIIANNQIGFTTDPVEGRSTLYASDLAKGFEIPIVHVNADDPVACVAIARMACAYRDTFGKDFLIDLVGYRRWGHNEAEEPTYTQPLMYQKIAAHPTVRQILATRLKNEGLVTNQQADELVTSAMQRMKEAKAKATTKAAPAETVPLENLAIKDEPVTAVSAERLVELNVELLALPEGFAINPKLERAFNRRRTTLGAEGGIEWGHAEALAFASILQDGIPIRLTGQDSERGTYTQRLAVMHDTKSGQVYTPLQSIPAAKASFALYNSPLSETACLGFEYGYSSHASGALVLWEAQFGDFANSAQVIIDQFLVSGAAKWRQTPSLVLLLPHGYEGQGSEHSSARIERFLQLAANGNIRILNCTTSAQYFHALRRQAAHLTTSPCPLIIMTPKSLLRHPRATSSLRDLSEDKFHAVLAGPNKSEDPAITRLILCSGKVYVDLAGSEGFATARNIAVGRIEELYPFPNEEIEDLFSRFRSLRQVVWLQEEPANMGAWTYMQPRLREMLSPAVDLIYVGREQSGSPAEGTVGRHIAEQDRIIGDALANVPQPDSKRSAVSHAA